MKDEQKVYIRGVEGRGDEVRQALINLGGKNVHDFYYGDSEGFFYITHDGEIRFAQESSEIGKIIIDNYRELHLPEKWKDGDVLITDEGLLFVLKGDYQVGDKDATIGGYCCVSEHQVCLSGHFSQIVSPRLASPSEVEHFHELMHKYGKDWDAEKKQVVDWQWKPKENDTYYYVDGCMIVEDTTFEGRVFDERHYEVGNCFRTYEEAEDMAEKIKKLLKGGSI